MKQSGSRSPRQAATIQALLTSYHHHLSMSTPSVPYLTFGSAPRTPTPHRLTLSSPPPPKRAKKTAHPPPAPPPPPAPSPPTPGPGDGVEPSVFDVLNVFRSHWFLNRDHWIVNVLSAQNVIVICGCWAEALELQCQHQAPDRMSRVCVCCGIARVKFAAEKRFSSLVFIACLQVCDTLFDT